MINGGIIESYGSNARLGDSEWMVVEADESDGSFLRLDGTIAVVTNIDPEHLDHYGSFDAVKEAFVEFIENVPFYGAAVLCIDHPEVQEVIAQRARPARDHLRLLRPGRLCAATTSAPDDGGNLFDAIDTRPRRQPTARIADIALPMPGRHNVQNALAAIAVAVELGCADDTIRTGFASFGGVRRRFTRVGEVAGATVIDDYAHHPVEIRAVLSAAREGRDGPRDRGGPAAPLHPPARPDGRVPELLQRCRHGLRRAGLSGRRAPIEGVDSAALVSGPQGARPPRGGRRSPAPRDLAERLADLIAPGDMVVCLGAGDITKWAAGLADDDRRAAGAGGMTGQPGSVPGRRPARRARTSDARLRRLGADRRARQAHARRAARQAGVVQERRRGRLAVRARRPRRPAAPSSRALDGGTPVMALGPRLEPDRARRRRARAWSCGSASRSPRSRCGATTCSNAAAGRAASSSPRPRATPASPGSSSCAAFPARSAASCG